MDYLYLLKAILIHLSSTMCQHFLVKQNPLVLKYPFLIQLVEELFSAARAEFKHLEYFYFHNCLYEGVWRDNARRWNDQTQTHEVLRTYGSDYKCIFVGDACMSPYEVAFAGGANEHWIAESGQTWL